jgi:hypothetical protein
MVPLQMELGGKDACIVCRWVLGQVKPILKILTWGLDFEGAIREGRVHRVQVRLNLGYKGFVSRGLGRFGQGCHCRWSWAGRTRAPCGGCDQGFEGSLCRRWLGGWRLKPALQQQRRGVAAV